MTDKERIKQLKEKVKAYGEMLKTAFIQIEFVAFEIDEKNFGIATNRAHLERDRLGAFLRDEGIKV